MNIYWAGGEDLDFPNGSTVAPDTTSGHFNSGWARCAVIASTAANYMIGSTLASPLTSLWIGAQAFMSGGNTSLRHFGVGKSGTSGKGIYIGASNSAFTQLRLYKWDGSTATTLATESGNSLAANALRKFDMQISNYGATSVINVYVAGVLALSFSGDSSISGVSDLDCVVSYKPNNSDYYALSEVVLADSDTRSLRVQTMAPTGAGTTDNWTGAYTDVNEVTLSDATNVSTNSTGQDEQFNVTDLQSGTFAVLAVRFAARAALGVGSTPTGLKLGFNSGGSVAVGGALTPGSSYGLLEQVFSTNPVTSAAWAQSDMNGLQMDLQSS